MNAPPAPPISVRRGLSYWDVIAILVVLGILAFPAEASRGSVGVATQRYSPTTITRLCSAWRIRLDRCGAAASSIAGVGESRDGPYILIG
jgi:hypothetical protein